MPVLNTRAPAVRSDGVVTQHEQLVRDLVASHPEIHRNGFLSAVRDLADGLDCTADCHARGLLPDAYRIERGEEAIWIYEVEVTHPVSVEKMRAYASFWFAWDSEGAHGWLPRLIAVDRFGTHREMDLARAFSDLCLDDDAPAQQRAQVPA